MATQQTSKTVKKTTKLIEKKTPSTSTKKIPSSLFNQFWTDEGLGMVARGYDARDIMHRALIVSGSGKSFADMLAAAAGEGIKLQHMPVEKSAKFAFDFS